MPFPTNYVEYADFLPLCSSISQERCTLQELNSSDEDSEFSAGSCLGADDPFFEELNAFLSGSIDWTEQFKFTESVASREQDEADCLKNVRLSPSDFYDLLADDSKVDFPSITEYDVDSSPTGCDRLYQEIPVETLKTDTDLVVLGVDLQSLTNGFCDDQSLTSSSTIRSRDHDKYRFPRQPQQQQEHYPNTVSHQSAKTSVTHYPSDGRSTNKAVANWYQSLVKSVPNQASMPCLNTDMKPTRGRRGQGGRQAKLFDEERTFPCPYQGCVRVYSKNSHLRAHLRRHTGEKPFVCQWPGCKWKFSRSDELARHRRSHSGVKPYQCSVCAKKFGRSDHLAKHVRIHKRQGVIIPPKGAIIDCNGTASNRSATSVKVQILSPCK